MRTIKIYCKVCKLKLTDELVEVNESTLKFDDGEALIAKDKFSFHTENGNENVVVAIDSYFFKNHTDNSRFKGCCGSSGLEGMNKTCSNGHEVATEVSDCCTPHYILFNLKNVLIKDITNEYKTITM